MICDEIRQIVDDNGRLFAWPVATTSASAADHPVLCQDVYRRVNMSVKRESPLATFAEKAPPQSYATTSISRQASPGRIWRTALLTAVILVIIPVYSVLPSKVSNLIGSASTQFTWADIPSRTELEFVKCYKDFHCAKLQLPLDYWNGTTDRTIDLAIMRLPAAVNVDHPDYGGSILLNPGGAGGSGLSMLNDAGKHIQKFVQGQFPGNENVTGNATRDSRFYDIVSFDPRGVGRTTPAVNCSGNSTQFESFGLRKMHEGSLISSNVALSRRWAMTLASARRCADVEPFSIQHYMTTASVARDMLELVEALARWRQGILQRAGSKLVVKPKEEKLQYWGFSYGSVLGATFAAMYPDQVGRLVLDGVADAEHYTGIAWANSLVDTERDMESFYHNCARVGYPVCALADEQSPSAEKVKARTAAIYAKLAQEPLPVSHPYPDMVTWSDVRYLNFRALYQPYKGFAKLAEILATIEVGNASLAASKLENGHFVKCADNISKPSEPLSEANYHDIDPMDRFTMPAIICTDREPESHLGLVALKSDVANLTAISPTAGDLWAENRMPCLGYPLRAHHRFTGPWTGNTSFPLLFIGNTADPVTPLSAARKMARGFDGAGLLVNDVPGHTSGSVRSYCVARHVHEYFVHGRLPPAGTVCAAPMAPFDKGAKALGKGKADSDNEGEDEDNGHVLATALARAGGFMGMGRG